MREGNYGIEQVWQDMAQRDWDTHVESLKSEKKSWRRTHLIWKYGESRLHHKKKERTKDAEDYKDNHLARHKRANDIRRVWHCVKVFHTHYSSQINELLSSWRLNIKTI